MRLIITDTFNLPSILVNDIKLKNFPTVFSHDDCVQFLLHSNFYEPVRDFTIKFILVLEIFKEWACQICN